MTIFDLISTANHNLLRNKTRTFLTIVAIFVGSFSIITTTAIQNGVNSFIDNQVNAFGGEGFIQITSLDTSEAMASMSSMQSGKPVEYQEESTNFIGLSALTDEQINQVKQIEGIDADSIIAGKSSTITYVESEKSQKRYKAMLDIMTNGSIRYDLLAGTNIDNQASEYQAILPSEDWVTALGFADAEAAVGQKMTFVWLDVVTKQSTKFPVKIVGVQAPSVITGGTIIINTSLNDAIYDENNKYLPAVEKNKIYTIAAEYDYQHYDIAEIKSKLADLELEGMTVADIVGQIKTFFDVILTVFTAFGYIALLAAAIGIINTLFMAVQERTREIGLMKSFGMGNLQIFLSFALEAVMLGFWGSVLGTLVSMAVGYTVNDLAHANDGFLQTFPTFNLVEYTPQTIIPIILLVMLIAFLAGVIPARRASRKDPIDALRYE